MVGFARRTGEQGPVVREGRKEVSPKERQHAQRRHDEANRNEDEPTTQAFGIRVGHSFSRRLTDRALSCRPPVTLPWSTDGRPPVPLTDGGGRRLGRPRALRGGGRSAPMPC